MFIFTKGRSKSLPLQVLKQIITVSNSNKNLRTIQMATGKPFREIELPQQKPQDEGVLFPAVLSPNSTALELFAFEDAIRTHKPWLESLLLKSGAILFRGFPVISPYDFNRVVEAFGFPELPYVGGAAPRTQVVDRVYTANESPLDKEIPFHHEMAYLPNPPTKLFFFCEEEPEAGGETPIVLSHVIYEKMKEKHPYFVEKMEEHGLRYTKITGDDDNPSSYTGSSWKSAYKTDDKTIAEERAAKQGIKLEWMGNTVKIISKPLPAIRFDEESRRKTWFNSLVVSYYGPATEKIGNPNTSAEVGNGDPVDDDAVKDLLKIMKEECVVIPWKKGDFLLVNNLTVLHSRRPLIKPPRRILASLCK
ncbi:putative TauD/TfdA-like domain, taurine dioxygenase TauD-like superfamily [Helianthus anomalus]